MKAISLPWFCHYRSLFFFFNDTATTEIYTLSLHDALPISSRPCSNARSLRSVRCASIAPRKCSDSEDRKSTRLNSSHLVISYAVFCLKKKKVIIGFIQYQQDTHLQQYTGQVDQLLFANTEH